MTAPRQALRWLERVRPDVIVLDLMVLRREAAPPGAHRHPDDRVDLDPVGGARIGDTRLVRKDEGPEALLAALREMIRT